VAEGTIRTFLRASENSEIATNCALTKAVIMLKKVYDHPLCFILIGKAQNFLTGPRMMEEVLAHCNIPPDECIVYYSPALHPW